jgi:hypothetical protein
MFSLRATETNDPNATIGRMEDRPSVSLLTLLRLVQKSPMMYVGVADSARGVQLDRLEVLISGYSLALTWHGLRDPGHDLYMQFSPYLEKRFGLPVNRGPIRAIRDASKSDAQAWKMFWRLLWEFTAAHEPTPD